MSQTETKPAKKSNLPTFQKGDLEFQRRSRTAVGKVKKEEIEEKSKASGSQPDKPTENELETF